MSAKREIFKTILLFILILALQNGKKTLRYIVGCQGISTNGLDARALLYKLFHLVIDQIISH